jgi:hypothetical protein
MKDTTGNETINVSKIDKVGVNIELRKFKNENGSINYPSLFNIPISERIPAMAKMDLRGTISIISVALTLAMETINVSRKMNSSQIVDLAETIVDTAAGGDIISLEDLMLFLQKLTRGEYKDFYEGIDQVKFMVRFNEYRDERFSEAVRLKEEKHEEFKRLGDDNSFERNNRTSPFGEEALKYRQKIQERKDEVALLKRENNILKQQNNF